MGEEVIFGVEEIPVEQRWGFISQFFSDKTCNIIQLGFSQQGIPLSAIRGVTIELRPRSTLFVYHEFNGDVVRMRIALGGIK